ncbi:MAG: tetratricopeptide repeat protein [Pyrinomonadaceae bacterium]|nr:tetratricopeptide repeat protein [Pyrinomonadaceae bacterium]MBP6211893.1 tetratricopeptide repeat protein [Pyrinomonadaceae bacterium]
MRSTVLLMLMTLSSVISLYPQNISDEARRHFDRGMAAVEMAKTPDDLNVAISEFKQATVLAPDWADAHFNLGKMQEATEKFTEAIASFRKYLQLAPNAADAGEVTSLINKIEYKAETVMTVQKVVNVLSQLSKWKAKGGGGFNAFVRGMGPTTVEVPTSVLRMEGRTEPDVFRKNLTVEGPRASFHYTEVLMDKKKVGNITRDFDVELEVVSLTKVKVREVCVWKYWALGGDTVTRISVYEIEP